MSSGGKGLPTPKGSALKGGPLKTPYEERIREAMPSLSPGFMKLAQFLLDSYTEAAFMTATELAQFLEVDPATVVRFSQRLGYPGYPELLREIRERVREDLRLSAEVKPAASMGEYLDRLMKDLGSFLERTHMMLREGTIETFVSMIEKSERILVVAERSSLPAGEALASALEEGGYGVRVARGSRSELARSLSLVRKGDVVIGLDASGESDTVARALRLARQQNAQTAAIVALASVDTANYAEVVLTGQATADPTLAMVSLIALTHILISTLRWKLSDRFRAQGKRVEAALEDLGARIFERREP